MSRNGMLEMWGHVRESSRADRYRFVAQRQGRIAFHKIQNRGHGRCVQTHFMTGRKPI